MIANPKYYALATFSPRAKQKQKKEQAETLKAKFPTKHSFPTKALLIHDHDSL